MADRSSGYLTIYGPIATAKAIGEIISEILDYGPKSTETDDRLDDDATIAAAILAAADGPDKCFGVYADEITGGEFPGLEDACEMNEVFYKATWDGNYAYPAGARGYSPAAGRFDAADEDGAVPLAELIAAHMEGLDGVAALIARAKVAAGHDMPPLSLSAEARAELQRIAAGDEE